MTAGNSAIQYPMIKLYLFFILMVLTAVVVSSRWLPVWAAAIIIPGSVLLLIWFTVWLIKGWFKTALVKSLYEAAESLQGATVTVHGCHIVPEPESARRERELEAQQQIEIIEQGGKEIEPNLGDAMLDPVRWVAVEISVHPVTPEIDPGEIDLDLPGDPSTPPEWHPEPFVLVPGDSKSFNPKGGFLSMFTDMQATVARTERLSMDGAEVLLAVDVYENPEETPDDDNPLQVYTGPARVRLTFGIPAELNGQVILRFLMLDLARLTLPAR